MVSMPTDPVQQSTSLWRGGACGSLLILKFWTWSLQFFLEKHDQMQFMERGS
jgi:hypothetical protein